MVSAVLKISVVVLLTAFAPAFASVVKMSNSGICHPPQSSWYERTKNFEPFNSIDACLAAGGRLPKGMTRPTGNDPGDHQKSDLTSYSRSAFGHGWADSDGDCQDSRAEALIATSTTTVRFATDKKCLVVTGRWISPFTGDVIQNSSEIEIDHIVPLKWAWQRGASGWSRARRVAFANDMINLWPVEASLNGSKSARGPDQWLPPVGHCAYVARFYRITKMYQINPQPAEAAWTKDFLEDCRS